MLYISLKEVQDYMPECNVYALTWVYFPELEHYRANLWMNIPFKDAAKCRYDKYVPIGLAPDVEHVLQFLSVSLAAELKSNIQRGLSRG